MKDKYLDCLVIGYNELPFERYESFLHTYGEDSEAYRDLKFSFVNLGGVRNLVFIDDTFNVPFPRFKDICRLMIRKNYHFDWFSYFRCSNSDEEAIELMAESGCKDVFLGIESGSPTILANMNKSATVEKYAKGIEMLRRHDILTFGSFIIGFSGETDETVAETTDFIRATKPDYYRAQMWYCEPGTPMTNREAPGVRNICPCRSCVVRWSVSA